MPGNTYFGCAHLYRCVYLHLFVFHRDKKRNRQREEKKKQHENTVGQRASYQDSNTAHRKLMFTCVCATVLFNSLTARVTQQCPCQSETHTSALDMKKPTQTREHTVHTETQKYTPMAVLGIRLMT